MSRRCLKRNAPRARLVRGVLCTSPQATVPDGNPRSVSSQRQALPGSHCPQACLCPEEAAGDCFRSSPGFLGTEGLPASSPQNTGTGYELCSAAQIQLWGSGESGLPAVLFGANLGVRCRDGEGWASGCSFQCLGKKVAPSVSIS